MADDEEVESVQVQRVALDAEDAGALHHQLHVGAVRDDHQLGPVGHVGVVGRRPRVVERRQRRHGEVRLVDAAGQAGEVRVQQRLGREHEGDVVHGRRELRRVGGALARGVGRARVRAQPHREEEPLVHRLRHRRRVLRRREAEELGREVADEAGVVELRQRRPVERQGLVEARRGGGRVGVLVLEDAGDGGVVEGGRPAGGVGPGGHVVVGGRVERLRGEEHVGGLARGDHQGVDGEGLDVDGVDLNDGERVVGDGEKELVVERRVDEAEHVRLPWLHLQLERVCGRSIRACHSTCMHAGHRQCE